MFGPAPHLVYRTIGGVLDIYFFPGPSAEDVVRQYAALVGKPALPPYWAFGYQVRFSLVRQASDHFCSEAIYQDLKNISEKGMNFHGTVQQQVLNNSLELFYNDRSRKHKLVTSDTSDQKAETSQFDLMVAN